MVAKMNIGYSFPSAKARTGFYLRLMGPFTLVGPEKQLLDLPAKKLQLLLAVLAFRGDEPMERRELARLIWSRHAEENALTSLRQALAKLRQLTNGDFDRLIISDRRFIRINTEFTASDICQLRAIGQLTEQNLSRWVDLCAGLAFEDLRMDDQPVREWFAKARCELFFHMTKLLSDRLQELEARGEDRLAIKWVVREKERIERLFRDEGASLTLLQLGDVQTRLSQHRDRKGELESADQVLPAIDPQLQKYKSYLRYKVESFWVRGFWRGGADNRPLMDLKLESAPELVRNPYDQADSTAGLLLQGISEFKSSEILGFYRESQGSLLVVGDPGAGKTTLLLRLVADLLKQSGPSLDVTQVPVVVNASGWTAQKGSFREWLIDELDYRYDLPGDIGQQLISGNHLAFFIDELDEINHADVHLLVETINEFRKCHPQSAMAFFCRTQWYLGLDQPLSVTGAARIKPVDKEMLNTFLQSRGASAYKYAGYLQMAESTESLTSPLAVHVTLELADSGSEPVKDKLVERYVDTLLAQDNGDTQTRDQLARFLPGLARMMIDAGRSIFYMDDFVDTSLYSKSLGFWVRFIPVALIACLCATIVSGLAYRLVPGAEAFYLPLLIAAVGTAFILSIGNSGDARMLPRYRYGFSSFRKNLAARLACMLFSSLAALACCWMIFGLKHGLVIGGGVLFVFIVSCCLDYRTATSPRENFGAFYQLTRRAMINACYGVPMGFLTGLVADYYLFGYWHVGLASLLFACIFFFVLGGHAVLQSYVARWLLAARGQVPLEFVSFVEAACARKLLCRVGGGVMFPHRSVMEYLAGKASR
jgi:DNA-binding SARP family transcriptional activator